MMCRQTKTLLQKPDMRSFYVMVDAIDNKRQRVVASASNGGPDADAPKVTWELPLADIRSCFIGKRYKVTVEEDGV